MSQFFASGGQNIGISASTSVLPNYSGLISFRIDWFGFLVVQRTLKSLHIVQGFLKTRILKIPKDDCI